VCVFYLFSSKSSPPPPFLLCSFLSCLFYPLNFLSSLSSLPPLHPSFTLSLYEISSFSTVIPLLLPNHYRFCSRITRMACNPYRSSPASPAPCSYWPDDALAHSSEPNKAAPLTCPTGHSPTPFPPTCVSFLLLSPCPLQRGSRVISPCVPPTAACGCSQRSAAVCASQRTAPRAPHACLVSPVGPVPLTSLKRACASWRQRCCAALPSPHFRRNLLPRLHTDTGGAAPV